MERCKWQRLCKGQALEIKKKASGCGRDRPTITVTVRGKEEAEKET